MSADEERRFAPSASFAQRFDSAERFSDAIPGGRFAALTGMGQPFSAAIRMANLAEGVSLRAFSVSSPITVRSEMVGGDTPTITFMLPLMPAPRIAVDGVEVRATTVFSRTHGDMPVLRTGGHLELGAICILHSALRRAAAGLTGKEHARLFLSPATIRQADPARLQSLQAACHLVDGMVGGATWPDAVARKNLLRLLRQRIEATLVDVLDTDSLKTDHRAHQLQTVSMRRIDRLIDEHAEDPIGLRDLCEQSGLALRTIESIIRRRMGMTALAYLQRRQIAAARRALLAPGDRTTVTSVAFDHGFAHLGRFASFYRHVYGELPSQTLRNVQGAAKPAVMSG